MMAARYGVPSAYMRRYQARREEARRLGLGPEAYRQHEEQWQESQASVAWVDQRTAAAYHEAGHATVALVQGDSIYEVTIDDPDGGGTFRSYEPPQERCSEEEANRRLCSLLGENDYNSTLRRIIGLAAGAVAQRRVDANWDRVWHGAESDRTRATMMAKAVAGGGWQEMLDRGRREAEKLIGDNWDVLERIAHALLQRGSLSGAEVERAIRGDYETRGPAAYASGEIQWRRDGYFT